MEPQPLVSVVIPAWNHARALPACLASLAAQTEQPMEVIVVDDGSTDGTAEFVAGYRGPFVLAFIRFPENRGAPAARNAGATRARGEFLLFLDADAVLIPQAIARMREALRVHPEAVFAYSAFRFGWKKFPSRPFDAEALRRAPYIHTSSLMRRSAFPGFDESLKKFQDWDVWLTIAERGGRGEYIPEELFRLGVGGDRRAMSRWLPSFAHRLPWPIFGWMPQALREYRKWEQIVKQKHGIV